jgi:hypothetical protein
MVMPKRYESESSRIETSAETFKAKKGRYSGTIPQYTGGKEK